MIKNSKEAPPVPNDEFEITGEETKEQNDSTEDAETGEKPKKKASKIRQVVSTCITGAVIVAALYAVHTAYTYKRPVKVTVKERTEVSEKKYTLKKPKGTKINNSDGAASAETYSDLDRALLKVIEQTKGQTDKDNSN